MRRNWDRHWFAWAMAAPVVLVLSVLVFYPLGRGIYLSFTNTTEANQNSQTCVKSITGGEVCQPNPDAAHFIGLDNYTRVLSGEIGEFWHQLMITLIWTVGSVVFHYGLGLGLAVLLNRPMRLRGLYRVLLVLPWAVPSFVSAFTWRYMFNEKFGLINGLCSPRWSPTSGWACRS
jgi:arabinogalactan oligomer/maltooligosaccharide transport system permease protein